MPPGVPAVHPQQSSADQEGLPQLILLAGLRLGDQALQLIGPAVLLQPITDQCPGLVLQRQDVFGDGVDVEPEG